MVWADGVCSTSGVVVAAVASVGCTVIDVGVTENIGVSLSRAAALVGAETAASLP